MWCSCEYLFSYLQHELKSSKVWVVRVELLLGVLQDLGFPGGSAGKESAYSVGDLGSIPDLGRSPGGGHGYPLQYSGLENSVAYTVHGVAKSRTGLSDFLFH